MAKGTIRGIHAILSGAFEAAMRWEWTDRIGYADPGQNPPAVRFGSYRVRGLGGATVPIGSISCLP